MHPEMHSRAPGPDREPAAASLNPVLDALAKHLNYLKEEGITSVAADPEVVARLSTLPPAPPDRALAPRDAGLAAIAQRVAACEKCALHKTRTRTVPGQGNPHPDILFVGEGPGEEEDIQGLAFVGAAGQLLTKMIEAMGYGRKEVFIANIVKCRPPGNRAPLPEEMEACLPYLKAQIAALKPRVIVALGATAVKGLIDPRASITRLRGHWRKFEGIDVMPTYHPAYLLRAPSAKKEAWADLKETLRRLGRRPPPRSNAARASPPG
jgi:DNA polymerase